MRQPNPPTCRARSVCYHPLVAADAGVGASAHRRLRLWWVSAFAVVFGLAACLASAWRAGETPDEPTHFEWSRRLLDTRITERRSNEYFESKAPISMLNVAARRVAKRALGRAEPRALLFASRLPTVGLFALLLGTVFLAARAWVGPRAAHLATIACALDPSLIAHGGLGTVDVAFALFHLLTLCAAYALVQRPSVARGVFLGLALGLAFATKFSAVLLFPGAALAVLTLGTSQRTRKHAGRVALGLLAAGAAITLTICAAYLFTQVGTPLADIRWDSAPMTRLAELLPRLRLPLPADFLTGFDLSLARERDLKWRVVVFGTEYPRGVWYYFVLLWLMKTPFLILVAQVAGYLLAARAKLFSRQPALRFLALNLLLLLAYFSFLFHAQIGYRFVLMCLPLGYMIAAAGLASLEPTRHVRTLGALLLLVTLGENVAYWGNHLAFTNLAVQPKKLVFRWITHSNVDWRQNEDRLESYLVRAGIGRERLNPPHLLAGRNLLRHSHAGGNLRFERYRWVRENLTPVTHYDHTFLLFDLSAAEFERLLEETRRIAPSPRAAELCPAGASSQPTVPGQSVPLSDDENPRRDWLVCVDATDGADIAWRAASGSAVVGPADQPKTARDFVEADQEVWYRLAPGRHVLALSGQDGIAGTWRVERGSARFTLRWATAGK
jgi:Dolichyl-phosphate-mannose-protein mannosyltransferase